ncbi:MAG: hypothetical protein IPM57_06920 [Oligoflexia bacterium]|nr:hypothetical protein [Oligoflexia bacterium]
MTSKFLEETNNDFKEFTEIEPIRPPQKITEQLFIFVHRDLNPNPWYIFSKLSLIHFVVGIVTLSFCPQFGVRFFGEGIGVMRFFLQFGTYGCMVLCGAFFVGSSFFVSSLVLGFEELRVLRRHRTLQISALTLVSLGAFIMLDAEVLLVYALAWIIGSIFGGLAMFELGRIIRKLNLIRV